MCQSATHMAACPAEHSAIGRWGAHAPPPAPRHTTAMNLQTRLQSGAPRHAPLHAAPHEPHKSHHCPGNRPGRWTDARAHIRSRPFCLLHERNRFPPDFTAFSSPPPSTLLIFHSTTTIHLGIGGQQDEAVHQATTNCGGAFGCRETKNRDILLLPRSHRTPPNPEPSERWMMWWIL